MYLLLIVVQTNFEAIHKSAQNRLINKLTKLSLRKHITVVIANTTIPIDKEEKYAVPL